MNSIKDLGIINYVDQRLVQELLVSQDGGIPLAMRTGIRIFTLLPGYLF